MLEIHAIQVHKEYYVFEYTDIQNGLFSYRIIKQTRKNLIAVNTLLRTNGYIKNSETYGTRYFVFRLPKTEAQFNYSINHETTHVRLAK